MLKRKQKLYEYYPETERSKGEPGFDLRKSALFHISLISTTWTNIFIYNALLLHHFMTKRFFVMKIDFNR